MFAFPCLCLPRAQHIPSTSSTLEAIVCGTARYTRDQSSEADHYPGFVCADQFFREDLRIRSDRLGLFVNIEKREHREPRTLPDHQPQEPLPLHQPLILLGIAQSLSVVTRSRNLFRIRAYLVLIRRILAPSPPTNRPN